MFPFGNTVSVITMTGENLLKVFEHAVEDYKPEDAEGAFLQVAGRWSILLSLSSSPTIIYDIIIDIMCMKIYIISIRVNRSNQHQQTWKYHGSIMIH